MSAESTAPPCSSFRSQSHILTHFGLPTPQLFNLVEDPLENKDLKEARPDVYANLTRRLRKHYDDAATPAWMPDEATEASSVWWPSDDDECVGYVVPWHRPHADVSGGPPHPSPIAPDSPPPPPAPATGRDGAARAREERG